MTVNMVSGKIAPPVSVHFFGESKVVALDISKARVMVLVTLLFDGYRIFYVIVQFVL